MTMDPSTGEGFDAVLQSESEYFDPNAQDPAWPGATGLTMRKKTYWQGDVEFDVFETVGPKYGPKWPEGTLDAGGIGVDADVWGLSSKTPPGPNDPVFPGNNGVNAGTNTTTAWQRPGQIARRPFSSIAGGHEPTPCFELDGSPTLANVDDAAINITLLSAYGGDVKFPVMPENFGADFTHEYWTPRVVGLGEIVMPGGQSMETISWDSFFPAHYDPEYVTIAPTELEDPRSVAARLIWTMRFKMDCMLVVGGGLWGDRVVITNFKYIHQAGEPFDIYYSISFKRYRAPIVTTAVNPDTEKDRWYKDPRVPGQAALPSVGAAEEQPEEDANPAFVPIEPDTPAVPTVVPFDEGPAISPTGREALITIETDTVRPYNVAGMYAYEQQQNQEQEIAPLAKPVQLPGETLQQVSERLNKYGPNDVAGLLAINQWVTDNGYDPYSSHLPIGSGVRYYKENPITVTKPLTQITPYWPIADQKPGDQPIFGPRPQVLFPSTPKLP